jgi:Mn2+/Fe2+ NRAMP family transporter
MMVVILFINFGNILGEFAGIAGSLELFSISRYISVPICALIVWLMVVKGQYKSVEKIFLVASFIYITYIAAGILAKPDWIKATLHTVKPPGRELFQHDYLFMTITVIGTTIAPWMQFYLQASVVEKGITRRQYKTSQLDVISGCIFTDVVAWFIIVACAATLYAAGMHQINDAKDAAEALKPLVHEYAYILFAVGLFNASLFAASILPLSTAYTVCEGLGFESGIGKKFSEAPAFYWLYTGLIAAGAGLILLPNLPLIKIQLYSQALNGIAIAPVLIFMLLLVNKKELMGEYVNSKIYNAVAWGLTVVMIVLSVPFVWDTTRQVLH